MGYRIDFALHEATLRAVVSGRSSLEHAPSIGRDIAEQATRLSARSLLIDVRGLLGRVGTLGALLGPRALGTRRVAVLDVQENDPYYAFPEDAARRRGRSLRYFYDPKSALRWLSE
jgi:hypothetical protein